MRHESDNNLAVVVVEIATKVETAVQALVTETGIATGATKVALLKLI